MAKIEHVFTLMLENRSFDHMVAFAGIPGVNPPPTSFNFTKGAKDKADDDPPHEFEDVAKQINNGTMTGFPQYGGPDAMKGFEPARIPVLKQLIGKGILFDNYFSSMPGPTWPNRLFVHAASSGGLDNSMGTWDMNGAISNPSKSLLFKNGHIFDRLTAHGKTWRIYHGDSRPQVLSLKGMVDKKDDARFFREADELAADLQRGDTVNYTFIEPDYDLLFNFRYGDSQHPLGKVSAGEKLMAYVYNAIFKNPVGAKSALVITWDEHGGFFDHVPPPAATPPGDPPLNAARAKYPQNFPFNRFGARVPTVLISPWLPQGLGSQIYGPKAIFDHSSVVRALRETFQLGAELTKRDKASPNWNSKLLNAPRSLGVPFPAAVPKARRPVPLSRSIKADSPPGGNVLAWAQIAMDVDWHVAERLGEPPLHLTEYFEPLKQAEKAINKPGDTTTRRRQAELIGAQQAILEFIAAVERREFKLAKTRLTPAAKPRRAVPRKKPARKSPA
jgi:phospholipase C